MRRAGWSRADRASALALGLWLCCGMGCSSDEISERPDSGSSDLGANSQPDSGAPKDAEMAYDAGQDMARGVDMRQPPAGDMADRDAGDRDMDRADMDAGADMGDAREPFKGACVTRVSVVMGGQLELKSTIERSFDAEGRVEREEHDHNSDGEVDLILGYAYNAQGQRTSFKTDEDADGMFDSESRTTYDAMGRMIGQENYRGGMLTQRTTVSWSMNGALQRSETDRDLDNMADYIREQDFDAQGRLLELRSDNEGDGSWDFRSTYAYSPGQIVHRIDQQDDGDWDQITTTTLDARGRSERAEVDTDGDGQVNNISRYSYSSDAIVLEIDNGNDGRVNYRHRTGLDAAGNVLFVEVDYDGDGQLDERRQNDYSCLQGSS